MVLRVVAEAVPVVPAFLLVLARQAAELASPVLLACVDLRLFRLPFYLLRLSS